LPKPAAHPPVSILKPVHGRDPHFYEAIRSYATQDYPEFEILFGAGNQQDPALPEIHRLAREFPERRVRVVHSTRQAPNGKVGVLADLAAAARHPVLLVSDSDIRVEPGYLQAVTAPLEDQDVGLVTCLYRGSAESWPGRWEALGIATEFAPSVLVARMLGVAEFALGSTMVLRARHLRQIGGFESIAAYLADDYQLGRHIAGLGLQIALSPSVVETNLAAETWSEVWRHQVRWARTIRVSRPGGYYGYVLTHATLWSLAAICGGAPRAGLTALAIRLVAGILIGTWTLRDFKVLRYFYLIPCRDLWGFAVWVCGLFGDTVEWRGRRLRLTRDGKISAS
jgi:ceramide glucosyltransferase